MQNNRIHKTTAYILDYYQKNLSNFLAFTSLLALLKTAHRSPVKDTHLPAAGQTALYKYKAIYVENDVEVGAMSAEISIAVAGR